MLAHYLVGVISFDIFRAFTPGRDESLGIEHTDGVIRDRVDQKLEAMGIGELVDAAGGQGHISALQSNFEHVKGTVDPLPSGISRQEPEMISATASYYNKTPDIMISCSFISYVAAASVPISLHPFAMARGRNNQEDTPGLMPAPIARPLRAMTCPTRSNYGTGAGRASNKCSR